MERRSSSAIILYRTADCTILLQHRSADAPRYPDQWGCFGGGIEAGETPEEAVRREAFEEIEYRLKNPKLVDAEKNEKDAHYTFIEEYDPSQPIVLHEGQGYGWFTIPEALALRLTAHRRAVLEKLASVIFN